jgi:hypothetical protein
MRLLMAVNCTVSFQYENKMIFTLQKRTVRVTAVSSLGIHAEIYSFIQTQQYTVLTLGIRTIFTDQLPTFHVFKKVHTMLASKSSTAYN